MELTLGMVRRRPLIDVLDCNAGVKFNLDIGHAFFQNDSETYPLYIAQISASKAAAGGCLPIVLTQIYAYIPC